ncbi:MAG: transglycosylase SLT domain-containing protein [Chloroflexi bacterium]|nr:transglycosylase SLT domain-containing protein [Chloroflexota bacterium]
MRPPTAGTVVVVSFLIAALLDGTTQLATSQADIFGDASDSAGLVEVVVSVPDEATLINPLPPPTLPDFGDDNEHVITTTTIAETPRDVVDRYFPVGVHRDWAHRVVYCESRWIPDATNPTSGAAGLFQHMPQYWDERSATAGWDGYSIYHVEANVAVAWWLYDYGAGASHWACS